MDADVKDYLTRIKQQSFFGCAKIDGSLKIVLIGIEAELNYLTIVFE